MNTRAECSLLEARGGKRPAASEKMLVRFSVEVISAQQLPRPRSMDPEDNINPYIEVEVYGADDRGPCFAVGDGGVNVSSRHGVFGLGLPHRRRTRIEQSNGYSPMFNEQFRFTVETKYPELIFVRWTVWSSPDGRAAGANHAMQLATFTAKLSSLSQGYRYLPLYDTSGDQYLFSTLFCKITKDEPVPAQACEFDGLQAGRGSIFRQLGHSVLRRALSSERSHSNDER